MKSAGVHSALDYAKPDTRRGRGANTHLRTALACGITPAVLGTAIISAWLLTPWRVLELFGVLNILLGLLCTLVGVPSLVVYLWDTWQTKQTRLRRRMTPGIIAGAVLLANFPLCAFYVWVSNLYTVRVVNATGATVNSFVVADPSGQTWELGPIPAGGRRSKMIDAEGEGAIGFSTKINGKVVPGVMEGYITGGMGGERRTVTLNPDGTCIVQ